MESVPKSTESLFIGNISSSKNTFLFQVQLQSPPLLQNLLYHVIFPMSDSLFHCWDRHDTDIDTGNRISARL